MKVELELDQWSFILETLQMNRNNSPIITGTAISLLKPQLDEQYRLQQIASQTKTNNVDENNPS